MLRNLNPEYSGSMTERYLVFRKEDKTDDFRDKMQLSNRISGFLDLKIDADGDELLYSYDISGCRALSDICGEKPVDAVFLEKLLSDTEKIIIRGKSFMFEEDNYILHPSAMYFGADGALKLCYLSGYEQNLQEQLIELLGYLMNLVDVNDRESVYIYYTAYVLAKDENCTFSSLSESIKNAGKKCKTEAAAISDEKNAENIVPEKAGENKNTVANRSKAGKSASNGRVRRLLSRLALAAVMISFTAVLLFFIFYS